MSNDDQFDEQLRRMAKRSMTHQAAAVDTDAALSEHRGRLDGHKGSGGGDRRWFAAAAAAVVVMAGVVGIAWQRGDGELDLVATDTVAPTPDTNGTLHATAEASASPRTVRAGGTIQITPAGSVQRTCNDIVIIMSTGTDQARTVGQIAGDWVPAPTDGTPVTFPACEGAESDESISISVPLDVPAGEYDMCITPPDNLAGCATVTIESPPTSPAPTDPGTSPPPTPEAEPPTDLTSVDISPNDSVRLPASTDRITVSYLDPPPLYEPQPFAEIEITTAAPWVALGDGYAAVGAWSRSLDESQTGRVFVVPLDNPADVAEIEVEVVPTAMIAGPGPVIYGGQLQQVDGSQALRARFVAIALAGPNTGDIVFEVPGFIYGAEPYDNAYTHGADGVGESWADGELITPHLDTDGSELELPAQDWPRYDLINNWPGENPANDDVIDIETGQTRWALHIERDPNAPNHLEGRASPGANGTAIRMTWIGPRIGDNIDYGLPTVPVIAALSPDGTGTWHQLPEGWEVADSNTWGTLLIKSTDGITQLALFDPTTS